MQLYCLFFCYLQCWHITVACPRAIPKVVDYVWAPQSYFFHSSEFASLVITRNTRLGILDINFNLPTWTTTCPSSRKLLWCHPTVNLFPHPFILYLALPRYPFRSINIIRDWLCLIVFVFPVPKIRFRKLVGRFCKIVTFLSEYFWLPIKRYSKFVQVK